jgi:hypothetical protein
MTGFELAGLLRRRWYLLVAAAGVAAVALAAAVAATHEGATRDDSYRQSAASLLLVGGLVLALSLGSTTIARGGDTGHLGLLVASGATRTQTALARLGGRLLALAACLALWLVALQVGSIAIGRGTDGPLAVHVAASAETLALVVLAAAAVSTVLGPMVAAVAGLATHITAQAVVNLKAAADLGLIESWSRLVSISYNVLPRAIYSPMIVEMQNRGEGGPAAPQFEVNRLNGDAVPVPVPAADLGTVLWTLFWCALLGWFCVLGMRRRAL